MNDKIMIEQLIVFLSLEAGRLERMIPRREALRKDVLIRRGPEDSYVLSEATAIQKMKDRHDQYVYFVNEMKKNNGAGLTRSVLFF